MLTLLSKIKIIKKYITKKHEKTKEAKMKTSAKTLKLGGEGGIRTLDTSIRPYNGLANRRLQPLGHLSEPISNIIH